MSHQGAAPCARLDGRLFARSPPVPRLRPAIPGDAPFPPTYTSHHHISEVITGHQPTGSSHAITTTLHWTACESVADPVFVHVITPTTRLCGSGLVLTRTRASVCLSRYRRCLRARWVGRRGGRGRGRSGRSSSLTPTTPPRYIVMMVVVMMMMMRRRRRRTKVHRADPGCKDRDDDDHDHPDHQDPYDHSEHGDQCS
jgi:hypothetical protein